MAERVRLTRAACFFFLCNWRIGRCDDVIMQSRPVCSPPRTRTSRHCTLVHIEKQGRVLNHHGLVIEISIPQDKRDEKAVPRTAGLPLVTAAHIWSICVSRRPDGVHLWHSVKSSNIAAGCDNLGTCAPLAAPWPRARRRALDGARAATAHEPSARWQVFGIA